MFEVTGVRAQQAIVLTALRRYPGRSVTVASLVEELNRGLASGVPSITHEDVECTLAALLLRPDLRASITFTTRPVAAEERAHRLSLGHALLASTVLLAACATPFGHRTETPKLTGYFGPGGAVPRVAPPFQTSGTPDYPTSLINCGDHVCLVKPTSQVAALSQKTAPSASTVTAAVSYFDLPPLTQTQDAPVLLLAEASENVYPPRAEAALWSPSFAAPTSSVASLSAPRALQNLDRITISAPEPRTVTAGLSLHPAFLLAGPRVDGAPEDSEHYLVTFKNGSRLLTELAQQQAASIAKTLSPQDKVELRGRVGKTTITPDDAKLAVDRAIAVRKQLVALGFSEKNIRIRLPKPSDLLDRKQFDAPVNMSVSVFRIPGDVAVAASSHRQPTRG